MMDEMEKMISMIIPQSELMYRSERFHENLKLMSSFAGSKKRVIVKSGEELLYFGKVDSSAMRKLDDWPEEITIVPTEDKPILRDVLESLMGDNVKIGARDGVGFIYCGKCKKKLFGWLEHQSDKVRWGNIGKLDKIKADICNFESEFAKILKGRKPPLSKEEASVLKKRIGDELDKKLKRYERKVENFKSTLLCPVTDIYRSMLKEEAGTYIVLFDGCVPAAGSMWTMDECNIEL